MATRTTLLGILDEDPGLTLGRTGPTIIGDKNDVGAEFETARSAAGLDLLRPARKGPTRPPNTADIPRPAS